MFFFSLMKRITSKYLRSLLECFFLSKFNLVKIFAALHACLAASLSIMSESAGRVHQRWLGTK